MCAPPKLIFLFIYMILLIIGILRDWNMEFKRVNKLDSIGGGM